MYHSRLTMDTEVYSESLEEREDLGDLGINGK
jgi:hypothetical protein